MDSMAKARIQEYIQSFQPLYNAFSRAREGKDNRVKHLQYQSDSMEEMDDLETVRPGNQIHKGLEYQSDRHEDTDDSERIRPVTCMPKAYRDNSMRSFHQMYTAGSESQTNEAQLDTSMHSFQKMQRSWSDDQRHKSHLGGSTDTLQMMHASGSDDDMDEEDLERSTHAPQEMHTTGSDDDMYETDLEEESIKPLKKRHVVSDNEITNSPVPNEEELESPEMQNHGHDPKDMWPLDKLSTLLFCEVCNVPFTTQEYLDEHSKIHSEKTEEEEEKPPVQMELNGEVYFDESGESCTEGVKPKKKNSKKFVCEFCNQKFKTIDDLSVHSAKHARERTKFIRMFDSNLPKPFVCQICGASFAKVYYLTKHEKLHQEKQFQCDICQAKFVRKYTLQVHKLIHSDEKPYKCKVCEAAFTRKGNLIQHSAVHAGEKPFKCTYCDGAFSNKNKLNAHIKMHTGKNLFKCDECDATFELRAKLSKHKQIHSGVRPYSCHICNASFIYEASLRKHLKKGVHDPNKLFQCHYCDQELTSKLRLENHLKIHTDDKPYKCSYCSAAYAMKCTLQVHQRIHTGERTFKCETCNAVFAQKHSLIVHKRIHTGEKPFKCHICNAAYMQKACLSIHLKLHSTTLEDEALAAESNYDEANMAQRDTEINNFTDGFGGQYARNQKDKIDNGLESNDISGDEMYKRPGKMDKICQKILDEMQDQAHTYEKMKKIQENVTGGANRFENTDGYSNQFNNREDGLQKNPDSKMGVGVSSGKGRQNKKSREGSENKKVRRKKDLQKRNTDHFYTNIDMNAEHHDVGEFGQKRDHRGEYKHFTKTNKEMVKNTGVSSNDCDNMNEAAQRVRNWILQGRNKYSNDIGDMKSYTSQSDSSKDDAE